MRAMLQNTKMIMTPAYLLAMNAFGMKGCINTLIILKEEYFLMENTHVPIHKKSNSAQEPLD